MSHFVRVGILWIDLSWNDLGFWRLTLNVHISRGVREKQVTRGEIIPKWLLLKLKVVLLK